MVLRADRPSAGNFPNILCFNTFLLMKKKKLWIKLMFSVPLYFLLRAIAVFIQIIFLSFTLSVFYAGGKEFIRWRAFENVLLLLRNDYDRCSGTRRVCQQLFRVLEICIIERKEGKGFELFSSLCCKFFEEKINLGEKSSISCSLLLHAGRKMGEFFDVS